MGGQRRACAAIVLFCALTTGCAADAGAGPACDLPDGAELVAAPDGGMHVVWADGKRALLAFANGACVLNMVVVPPPRLERSEAELAFAYDYYRQSLAPCLNNLGFRNLAPPSRLDFVESGGNWSPYDAVFSSFLSSEEIATVAEVCPETPPQR